MGFIQQYKSLPINTRILLGLGIVMALTVALPLFIWGLVTQKFEIREKADVEKVSISIEDEPHIGQEKPVPITIVEFEDLMCPNCKYFAENILPQLLSEYKYELRFVIKDFPLTSIHPLAEKAAIAAGCAKSQGQFWPMHDLIFANQNSITEDSFATFAMQIGLDETTFNDCFQNQVPLTEINADIEEGLANNIAGTPTFFINGIRFVGGQDLDAFKAIIESELDDLKFIQEGGSITFTTTNQNPNVSVSPEDLKPGTTYGINVLFNLQNNFKAQESTTSGVPVVLLLNDSFNIAKEIPYESIVTNENGFLDNLSSSFKMDNGGLSVRLIADPTNEFKESDENNNELVYEFMLATTTPTATASPTQIPVGGGEPNSCGGTCGSNYNCKANLFCYQGYCRNPLCVNDLDCSCDTSSSTPTPVKKTAIPSSKATPTFITYSKGGNYTSNPSYKPYTPIAAPEENSANPSTTDDDVKIEPENKLFNKYVLPVVIIITLITVSLIYYAVKKNKSKIPNIVPPIDI